MFYELRLAEPRGGNPMKNLLLRLAVAVLSCVLPLTAFVAGALAAPAGPGSVELPNGTPNPSPWLIKGEVYDVRNHAPVTDFFGEITKHLIPGDVRVFTVSLSNNFTRPVEFFMRTAPVTHNPDDSLDGLVSDDLNAPGASFDDKLTLPDDDLLDRVWLTVTHPFAPAGSPPLYTGILRGDGLGVYDPGWTSLGTVAAGQTGLIEVTVIIPLELPNYFQNSLASVQWEFYAEYDNTPQPSHTPTPTPEEEILVPSEPPLTPPPEEGSPTPPPEESITPTPPPGEGPPDYDVVVNPPKTGDEQRLIVWVLVSSLAFVCLITILIYTIRKEREKQRERQ